MNLALASRRSVFAIIGVAWGIVFVTPEYGVPWALVAVVILTLAWRSGGAWLQGRRARRLWRMVATVMLLVLPFDLVFFSQSLLHAVLHVALVAQVLMLFEAPTPRLHRLLILLSLFNILAATQFTRSLVFAPLFLLYAGLAVVALTLVHLLETAPPSQDAGSGERRLEDTRPLVLAIGLATAAVVPLIVLLFLTLPRSEFSFLARLPSESDAVNRLQQLERARKQTGFSDQVELGDYGRVQEDPTVVLRVRFPRGLPDSLEADELYWRAGALNHYDGYGWTTTRKEFPYYVGAFPNATDRNGWARAQGRGRIPPTFDDTFLISSYFQTKDVRSMDDLRADPDLVEQEVFLELPYADNLVGLQSIVAVEGFFPRGLSTDMNNGLRIGNRTLLAEKISYTAFSHPPESRMDDLGGIPLSEYEKMLGHWYFGPFFRERYLQLPDNLSPEVRRLVQDLTAEHETVDDRVLALMEFFAEFSYSLETARVPLAGVPLDDFLFNTRQGYCEHFATAMVVMLRTAGIPARLANGFKGGVWNDLGEFFAVRQADAHTWAEVWVPRHGWLPVDPVPGGDAGSLLQPWIVPESNSYLLYAQSLWQEEVLGYNQTTQTRITAAAAAWLREQPGTIWDWLRRTGRALVQGIGAVLSFLVSWAAVLAPVAMGGALFLLYVWRNGLPGGALPIPGRRGALVPFYFAMLRSLKRAGLHKPASDPPRAFASRVSATRPDMAEDVAALTHLYERVRFGGRGLTREETAAVRARLRRVRRESRRTPAGVA